MINIIRQYTKDIIVDMDLNGYSNLVEYVVQEMAKEMKMHVFSNFENRQKYYIYSNIVNSNFFPYKPPNEWTFINHIQKAINYKCEFNYDDYFSTKPKYNHHN